MLALAFVPVNDIVQIWDDIVSKQGELIEDNLSEEALDYGDYFETNYIGRVSFINGHVLSIQYIVYSIYYIVYSIHYTVCKLIVYIVYRSVVVVTEEGCALLQRKGTNMTM